MSEPRRSPGEHREPVSPMRKSCDGCSTAIRLVRGPDASLQSAALSNHAKYPGDDSQAEDVIQQAYVSAYFHLDQFAERARFSTWLTKVAVHEALARVRRRRCDLIEPAQGRTAQASRRISINASRSRASGFRRGNDRLLEAAVETLPEQLPHCLHPSTDRRVEHG